MRFLAVDDDPVMLDLLVAALKQAGHDDVRTVTSAREAVREIQGPGRYDCFLFDIKMPEMDGIELCRFIRSRSRYAEAPVLMITAMTERDFIDRAFVAGATDYVTKPFDALELSSRVRLAARLVDTNRSAKDRIRVLERRTGTAANSAVPDPDAAFSVDRVPGMVDRMALENYLIQISRSEAMRSAALAFRIVEFGRLHAEMPFAALKSVLIELAEEVRAGLPHSALLLSYVGRGTLVGVTSHLNPGLQNQLRDEVTRRLEARLARRGLSLPCPLTVLMGVGRKTTPLFGCDAFRDVRQAMLAVADERDIFSAAAARETVEAQTAATRYKEAKYA